MDDLLREFLNETRESLETVDNQLIRFEQEPANAEILANVFRLVHTIKGTCGFLGLPRLAALTHAAESLLGQFRDGMPVTGDAVTVILSTCDRIKEILSALEQEQQEPPGSDIDLVARLDAMAACDAGARKLASTLQLSAVGPDAAVTGEKIDAFVPEPNGAAANQSIRVSIDALEHLMCMVSELVLTRNQLIAMVRNQAETDLELPLQRLSLVTAELQESVMKTRLRPIGSAWQKLPRMVRALAFELGKQIDLELHGDEVELDQQILDLIRDPLTHMVRNSADHGIEFPHERHGFGKPERGTIRLAARQESGCVVVEISDDGRGLDTARIRSQALAYGLASQTELATMSDDLIHRLIFAAGMSTADVVTDVSGRGVGMDVVRSNIDRVGGSIDVRSIPGHGCVFTIKIPLALAIEAALIAECAGERFAIPQVAVAEIVRVRGTTAQRNEPVIEWIRRSPVLRRHDKLLPLGFLRQLLDMANPDDPETAGHFVVVTRAENGAFGIVVDRVVDTQEIVSKPLSRRLRRLPMYSGQTILGDGSVILILDPNGIASKVGTLKADERDAARKEAATEARGPEKTALVLFRTRSSSPLAVPLSQVARLEEVDAGAIEVVAGRYYLPYRGQLMSLIGLDDSSIVRKVGNQPLLIFSDGPLKMALAVDRIVDIVEDVVEMVDPHGRPGILGTAIVKGAATEILDVSHYLPKAVAGAGQERVAVAAEFDREGLTTSTKEPISSKSSRAA